MDFSLPLPCIPQWTKSRLASLTDVRRSMTLLFVLLQESVSNRSATFRNTMDTRYACGCLLNFLKHSKFVKSVCIAGLGVYLLRRWVRQGSCTSEAKLHGKTVIITGANTGIGKETARDLARRGARVILACRDEKKGIEAAKEIRENTKGEVIVKHLDLASLASVRSFASDIIQTETNVHILINNAGIMCGRDTSEDGNEIQFATNYLGHFLLTNLLLDKLQHSAPARIINVSSNVHRSGKIQWDDLNLQRPENYTSFKAYSQSKLALILFTKELALRLKSTRVTTYAVHPGFVRSDFARNMPDYMPWGFRVLFDFVSRVIAKDVVQGAQTTIYCAVAEELEDRSGAYYSDCKEESPSLRALDEKAAMKLWYQSIKMVGLYTM